MGALSIWHWLIVALVVVLLFGGKRLGSLGKDLGQSIRGFRDAVNEKDTDEEPEDTATVKQASKDEANG